MTYLSCRPIQTHCVKCERIRLHPTVYIRTLQIQIQIQVQIQVQLQLQIHRYIDIFADQLSAECRTYFEAVQTAKAEKKMNSNMTDEEFLKALREHPELIPQVMQILTQEKQEVHPAG